jgi:hypothetical protein
MKYFKKYAINASILLIILFIVVSRPAYAYIDAGTGSLIIQFLIAGAVGGLFALKIFWRNVKTFFSKHFSRGTKEQ